MHELQVKRNVLHDDETTLQVFKEPGRFAETKSYKWLYRTGGDRPPNVLYDHQNTRVSKKHPTGTTPQNSRMPQKENTLSNS